MNKKNIALFALFMAVIVFVGYLTIDREGEGWQYKETARFTEDTVIDGDYVVLTEEQTTLAGGVMLTVKGNLTIDGAIGCSDGLLTIVAEGDFTLNGSLLCEEDPVMGSGVVIVLGGNAEFGDDSEISTIGHVQVVDSFESILTNDELDKLYEEVEKVSQEGQSVGPLVSGEVPGIMPATPVSKNNEIGGIAARLFNVANAQDPINPVITGRMRINTPPPGIRRLVIFNFPRAQGLTLQNFKLSGPDGRKGTDDTGGGCNAKGGDGEDAFRFTAMAPNLKVNNFTLDLGSGGDGGDAQTSKECDPGIAKGGKGGNSGNFRMVAGNKFEITGAFLIFPGDGGVGGGATALGKDGDAGEDGRDANATGGDGADNKKSLSVRGTVAGTGNVKVGDIVGGFGGPASAEPGNGGDGKECGQEGGAGGAGTGESGKGGDASLSGAPRMEFASDIGGRGGIVESFGGKGGNGGACDSTGDGGDGGTGGDAKSKEGRGGLGDSGRASDGTVLDETGGDGGDGGEGCLPGAGGFGGQGDPEGEDGEEGANLCFSITKEEDYISLLPGEIEVIQYGEYYIPIVNENVAKFTDPNGIECDGEEHWHPGQGGAINTMGYATPDSDPNNCGFGKTSEVPVQIIQDPNYAPEDDSQGIIRIEGGIFGNGSGDFVEVDSPVLVIPAGVTQ